jgi:hypothetical protein
MDIWDVEGLPPQGESIAALVAADAAETASNPELVVLDDGPEQAPAPALLEATTPSPNPTDTARLAVFGDDPLIYGKPGGMTALDEKIAQMEGVSNEVKEEDGEDYDDQEEAEDEPAKPEETGKRKKRQFLDADGIAHQYIKGKMDQFSEEIRLYRADNSYRGSLLAEVLKGNFFIEPPDPIAEMMRTKSLKPDPFYYRRIFVWLPDLVFWIRIRCPHCLSFNTGSRGFTLFPRRIIDEDHVYYLASMRFCCENCEKWFTSQNTDALALLPDYVVHSFPGILTAKSGINRTIATHLIPANDSGMGANPSHKSVDEAAHKFWLHSWTRFASYVQSMKSSYEGLGIPWVSPPQFSTFEDRKCWGG